MSRIRFVHHGPRVSSGVAFVVSVALMLVLLPGAGASAHSPLESSTPGSGDSLTTMPARIELSFSAAVKDTGATIVLADEQGDDWTDGAASADATTVTSPVKSEIPDGRYEIRWSVISFDGAPMSGVVRFTLGDAEPDTNPLTSVVTPEGASWFRVVVSGVVAALLGSMAYGLITVYGLAPTRLFDRYGRGPGHKE